MDTLDTLRERQAALKVAAGLDPDEPIDSERWCELAREYFDDFMNEQFLAIFLDDYSSRWTRYAAALATIEETLGEEEFRAAIAHQDMKWRKIFREAEERQRNLPYCMGCGEKCTYEDWEHLEINRGGFHGICWPCTDAHIDGDAGFVVDPEDEDSGG